MLSLFGSKECASKPLRSPKPASVSPKPGPVGGRSRSTATTSRTITRDETGFIAWIGTRDRHWCFDRALKACIDDARYQRSLRDEAARASAVAKARIEVLSDDQRVEMIAAREAEMLGLRYAESHVDCVGRTAELRAEIEALGGRE